MKKNTIKIIKDNPIITDSEIDEIMDFDDLMKRQAQTKSSNRFFKLNYLAFATFMVGLMGLVYWFSIQSHVVEDKIVETVFIKDPESSVSDSILSKMSSDTAIISNGQKSKQEKESSFAEAITSATADLHTTTENIGTKEKTTNHKSFVTEVTHLTGVNKSDLMDARPVKGIDHLYDYFRENLTYPDEVKKDSIEGKVVVTFYVLKDGSVSDIEISASLNAALDSEAIRLIKNMPAWIPATVNGTPINRQFSIPLFFSFKE